MTKLTPQELDERLFQLFEDVGSSTEDWYDVHTIGNDPDIECIHLTPKARESVKQLIRDCIEAVAPELHVCDESCNISSNEWRIGHKAYKDAESNTIDTIEANADKLLGNTKELLG